MAEDLAEHRRNSTLRELQGLLRGDPDLRARYDAATRGEIPAPEVLSMAEETTLSLRVPKALLDRAEQLVGPMGDDTTLATVTGGRVTRSTVLRVALLRGLRSLEVDFTSESSTDGDT